MSKDYGWIGVDLDGTLAKRQTSYGAHSIGAPIAPMVARVCAWIDEGRDVRIFTARMSHGDPLVEKAIRAWCLRHIGCELPCTNVKDHLMQELWDDRAVTVEVDTGRCLTSRKPWPDLEVDANTCHACDGTGRDSHSPRKTTEWKVCSRCGVGSVLVGTICGQCE